MNRIGTWWTRSKTDPRWDMEGRAYVGGFMVPEECEKAIAAKKKELGEEPPEDLTCEYMKD